VGTPITLAAATALRFAPGSRRASFGRFPGALALAPGDAPGTPFPAVAAAADDVAGIAAVVDETRRRLPRTRLLLLGVLPSERSAWVSETTLAINAALAARYRGSDVAFMDLAALFARVGGLDRGLFLDPLLRPPEPPLHPTAPAQARLAAAIEPKLAELLGEPAKPPFGAT